MVPSARVETVGDEPIEKAWKIRRKAHQQEQQEKRQEKKEKRLRNENSTRWVYVFDSGFRNGPSGTFKIGISVSYKERVKELKAGNPYGKILFAGLVEAAQKMEKELHRLYEKRRIEREMFALTKPDLFVIRDKIREVSKDFYQVSVTQ